MKIVISGPAPPDWQLSERPCIPAEFASGHVVRIVNERRCEEGIRPFRR